MFILEMMDYSDSALYALSSQAIGKILNDILYQNNFQYTSDVTETIAGAVDTGCDFEDTQFCMLASEKSLAKDWENEDDEHWERFLK